MPYRRFDAYGFEYARATLIQSNEPKWGVWWQSNERPNHWGRSWGNLERYSTKEEAMSALDEFLLKKGYVLLTEEQAEKLLLLL